jgi:hypothetical protein
MYNSVTLKGFALTTVAMKIEQVLDNTGVPFATKPGISLIILPLMRILQGNLKRTYLIV